MCLRNSDGLILTSINVDETNNKIIGAMVALLSDAAEKAKEELNLTEMISMVIKYKDATLLCRQIVIRILPLSSS